MWNSTGSVSPVSRQVAHHRPSGPRTIQIVTVASALRRKPRAGFKTRYRVNDSMAEVRLMGFASEITMHSRSRPMAGLELDPSPMYPQSVPSTPQLVPRKIGASSVFDA